MTEITLKAYTMQMLQTKGFIDVAISYSNISQCALFDHHPLVAFSSSRALILDVGGRRHKVLDSNFNIFPNTRLGKLVRAKTLEEILNLCDGFKVQ